MNTTSPHTEEGKKGILDKEPVARVSGHISVGPKRVKHHGDNLEEYELQGLCGRERERDRASQDIFEEGLDYFM